MTDVAEKIRQLGQDLKRTIDDERSYIAPAIEGLVEADQVLANRIRLIERTLDALFHDVATPIETLGWEAFKTWNTGHGRFMEARPPLTPEPRKSWWRKSTK